MNKYDRVAISGRQLNLSKPALTEMVSFVSHTLLINFDFFKIN